MDELKDIKVFKKNALSRLTLLSSNRYFDKMNPDRLHRLLHEVNFRYRKFSPSGCSKNTLATSSNIDIEIENARQKSYSPSVNYNPNFSDISSTPSKNRIKQPVIKCTPLKIYHTKSAKRQRVRHESLLDKKKSSPCSHYNNSSIKNIDMIINNCNGLKNEVFIQAHVSNKTIKQTLKNFDNISKIFKGSAIQENLIKRCKAHSMTKEDNLNDAVKVAKAVKRGRKVWKQNHISFMKNVDKIVYSFPIFKTPTN
jgi:hypothetical protein